MRKQEIEKGIPLFITNDKTNNEKIISSKIAALKAISECLFSRTILAAPGMLIVPEIIKRLKIQYPYRTLPWMLPPTEALIIKILLVILPIIHQIIILKFIFYPQSTVYAPLGNGNLSTNTVKALNYYYLYTTGEFFVYRLIKFLFFFSFFQVL